MLDDIVGHTGHLRYAWRRAVLIIHR